MAEERFGELGYGSSRARRRVSTLDLTRRKRKKAVSKDRGRFSRVYYVHELEDEHAVYRALDAACHLVALCTDRVVDYNRRK